jgi:acyl-CoA synthetase (AMP-forming)/AMP-acid ligase II
MERSGNSRTAHVTLLHEFVSRSAAENGDGVALLRGNDELRYAALAEAIGKTAAGLAGLGIKRGDRVAVSLPKQMETVVAMFAASAAGAVFVPVNPVLKPAQVGHILRDSGARVLITTSGRAEPLAAELESCPELAHLVILEATADSRVAGRACIPCRGS